MRNPTLLQCFHWYYPAGGELWQEVTALAPNLNEIGINMVCLTWVNLIKKDRFLPNMATRRSCWRPLPR